MQKYFINENIELNKSFKIESSDQHHIEKVMRNKNGDQIICVDLKHIQYLCLIENVQEGTILPIEKLDINNEKSTMIDLDINNELDVEVTLVYALPKGDKFEFVLQKACELGVHHIIPLSSKRCVVKLTKDKFNKKLPRYQKILKAASEQSGRNRIPSIEEVKTIKELKPYLKDYNLVAYEETAKQHEHGELFHTLQQLKAGDQLLIIVGCEGGFDESEIQELTEMGVKCCSLGNRILRSETAPLYLMSVIGYSRELIK